MLPALDEEYQGEEHPGGPPIALARKQRVRETAARLFAEHGVEAVGLTRISDAAGLARPVAGQFYRGRQDLLAELLLDHLDRLTKAVCSAQDSHADAAPEVLVEVLVRAWLECVAAEPDQHRALIVNAHCLDGPARERAALRHLLVLETVYGALAAAVPGLADRAEAMAPLLATLRALLSDPWVWHERPDRPQRLAAARRIAGMMLAAARAQASGAWEALGRVEGAAPWRGRLTLECRDARARMRELLDAAEAGAEVVITRRGRISARVVGAR